MPDIAIESEEPGRISIWAGNLRRTYIWQDGKAKCVSEFSRYRYHPSARPDELIEQADKLAREWFAAR